LIQISFSIIRCISVFGFFFLLFLLRSLSTLATILIIIAYQKECTVGFCPQCCRPFVAGRWTVCLSTKRTRCTTSAFRTVISVSSVSNTWVTLTPHSQRLDHVRGNTLVGHNLPLLTYKPVNYQSIHWYLIDVSVIKLNFSPSNNHNW
jgi:hypothetical protein